MMISQRRLLLASSLAAMLTLSLAPVAAQTALADRPHKVVFQVSDAEPAKWNLALNNAKNVQKDLGVDKVAVAIVAYGPGIGMLKMDSVAGTRVAEAMSTGVAIVACENTMHGQKLTKADMLGGLG